jgi:hypothetical protein
MDGECRNEKRMQDFRKEVWGLKTGIWLWSACRVPWPGVTCRNACSSACDRRLGWALYWIWIGIDLCHSAVSHVMRTLLLHSLCFVTFYVFTIRSFGGSFAHFLRPLYHPLQ